LGYAMFLVRSWGIYVFSRHNVMLAWFLLIVGCLGVARRLRVFLCMSFIGPLFNKIIQNAICI
jgi:hypothetical protein